MVVIHAPVLSPRYSTILAESGMEVCTHPTARASTSTWRRLCGVAYGLSGSAAIMAEMSEALANCFCGQPRLKFPLNPSGGQVADPRAGAAFCAKFTEPVNTRAANAPVTPNAFSFIVGSSPFFAAWNVDIIPPRRNHQSRWTAG